MKILLTFTLVLAICCGFMGGMLYKDHHSNPNGELNAKLQKTDPPALIPTPIPQKDNEIRPKSAYSSVTPSQTSNEIVLEAPRQIIGHKTMIYNQPLPDPVEDTTIVIYKPEIRQPIQRVVVVDEKEERLKREYNERLRNWKKIPDLVVR